MSLPNYWISSLAQTLTVGGNDTSIKLSTIYTQDGQVVTTADFAAYGRGIITVNPISLAGLEFISFTGITATTIPTGTLTGCLRGLSFKDNTQIAANQKFNVIGIPVIISFGTHNLLDIPSLAGNETFAGLITFTQPPISATNPTNANQVANKAYVDATVIAGAPNASDVVKGITKLSVAPVAPTNPIAVGDNDPRIITTGISGGIIGFTSTTVRVSSVLLTANALILGGGAGATPIPMGSLGTTTTVLHGNAGGAPTFSAVSLTADVSGILPVANGGQASFTNGITTKNAADASTTQNIAHGLGRIPKYIRITATYIQANSIPLQSITVYNGTTQSSYSQYGITTANGLGLTFSTDFTLNTDNQAADKQTGVVTFDNTNIIITWTKNNNPTGTYNLLWEAIG